MKLLLLGSSGVGKSCLLLRFVENSFYDNYFSTIGVDFVSFIQKFKTICLDGQVSKLQIWDTAGQERFRNITKFYYKGAHGLLLVFDICQRGSFEELEYWLNDISAHSESNIPILLVGNKIDDSERRVVSYEEAKAFADAHEMDYLETSAKESVNIDIAFYKLARKVKDFLDGNPLSTKTSFVVLNSKVQPSFSCCLNF